MKTILDILEGKKPIRKEGGDELFVSSRNYFQGQSADAPPPNTPPPTTEQVQVGGTAGIARVIDGDRTIELSPEQVYNAGTRGGSDYLLDKYTGAFAGYSLRKVKENWNYPVITVQRDSDNQQAAIGFVEDDLDTATLMTFAGSSTVKVLAIYDQSASGNYLSTSFADAGIIVQNGILCLKKGRPCIVGISTNYYEVGALQTSQPTPATIFAAFQVSTNNFSISKILGRRSGENLQVGIFEATGTSGFYMHASASTIESLGTAAEGKEWAQFTALFNGSDSSYRRNGIEKLSGFNTGDATATNITLFDSSAFNFKGGVFSELFHFAGDQSSNVAAIEQNQLAYYQVEAATNFLFDEYPGAAVGFSPARRLNSSYTGPIIRVRRADNQELDISTETLGEYEVLDIATLIAFCNGTDGFIACWYDQSGNGNDAVQATTSRQPKVYDSVAGVVLDDQINIASTDWSGQKFMTLTSDITVTAHSVIAVVRVGAAYLTQDNWANNVGFADTTGLSFRNGGGINKYGSYVKTTSLTAFYRNGTTAVDAYQNGIQLPATQEEITTQSATYSTLGKNSTRYYGSFFTELIIYPSDQSTNRAGIEANINAFYNIY